MTTVLEEFYVALAASGADLQNLDEEFKYHGSDPFEIRRQTKDNQDLAIKAVSFALIAGLFGTKNITRGLGEKESKYSTMAKKAMSRAAADFTAFKSQLKTPVTVSGVVQSWPEASILVKVLVPSAPAPGLLALDLKEELRTTVEADVASKIDPGQKNEGTQGSIAANSLSPQTPLAMTRVLIRLMMPQSTVGVGSTALWFLLSNYDAPLF